MMGLGQINCALAVVVFLSTFFSDSVFGSHVSSERRLLQATTPCPVNFEFQNYTIITSKCKGPPYSADLCCSSFKDFACPFANDINDLRNNCATTMFGYINRNGNYSDGLFASLCREGKDGLSCPLVSPPPLSSLSKNAADKNGGWTFPIIATSLVLSMQFI